MIQSSALVYTEPFTYCNYSLGQLDTLKVAVTLVKVVLTLVTVAWAALCSLPSIYRTHQAEVNQGVEKAKVVTCKTKLKAMEKVVEIKSKAEAMVLKCEAKLLVLEKAGQAKDLAKVTMEKVMGKVEHQD